MVSISDVEAKIDGHIDVCAIRYQGIEDQMRGMSARLKRIEYVMISSVGALLVGMAGLCLTLLMTIITK